MLVEEERPNAAGTPRCRLSQPRAGWCSRKMLGDALAPPPPPLPTAPEDRAALFRKVPPGERVATEKDVDDRLAASFKQAYVQTYPARDARWFAAARRRGAVPAGARVVCCVADSITHGDAAVSPDWVDVLQKRHPDAWLVNAGVGGDLAHNVLARVPDVAALGRVDAFTLLVGTNDARFLCGCDATCSDRMTTSYYAAQKKVPFGWKASPDLGGATPAFPSVARYVADVAAIVDGLAGRAKTPILVVSVPPLGDRVADFGDGDAEAANADAVVRSMNAGLREVCAARPHATYGAFHEACEARLAGLAATRALTPYSAKASNQLVADATKGRAVHGRTFDAVGESLGLVHCCDMIHPTEQAIFPLLELAESFLFPPDSP